MKPKELVTLKVINKSHPLRQKVEQYVASRYLLAFDAHITEFMPTFLGVYSEKNELLSVCGYRIASQEPLFLEQYLTKPAEQIMSGQFSQPIVRSTLIEFGQLASFSKGISPWHFLLMAKHLIEQGFEWCIFTATDPLYVMMVHLGLKPAVLGNADQQNINNAQTTWGTYYHTQPRVSAGNLKAGLAQLIQRYDEISSRQSRVKIS
ncbi:thermostable hemolysin [Psychromonas ingrahamii 37]|uniref:Thermostable hemolysin n=1 Tax=Psychromonas ingrahamii (strain DSM 17664 / CCUG 51855 / 37) TaxID=357804 RepID=A1STH9_PSYIN|nr:thermostable hemolysin [Psychromonas ingrahamii]ABM02794.1 thermostable hemolysin [Psychromonas ingrahamii 37]